MFLNHKTKVSASLTDPHDFSGSARFSYLRDQVNVLWMKDTWNR